MRFLIACVVLPTDTDTGNFYSITNENDTTAKIFFAQGCEMAPEPPDPYDVAALEQQ